MVQPVPAPACAPLERPLVFGGEITGVLDAGVCADAEVELGARVGVLLGIVVELLGILVELIGAD